jgi:hypothetical protein
MERFFLAKSTIQRLSSHETLNVRFANVEFWGAFHTFDVECDVFLLGTGDVLYLNRFLKQKERE